MLKIDKTIEPDFLKKYKSKNNPKNWNDYNDGIIKIQIKEHILLEEQNMYCPYCEKTIENIHKCHIEHIMPRDFYPSKFQDYDNLLVSCDEKNSCGNFKKNNYSSDFINIVIENPKEYLTYDISTGRIEPICKEGTNYTKANYTIKILNLNNYNLVQARAAFLKSIESMIGNIELYDYLDFLIGEGIDFIGLVKQTKEEYCV